MNNLPVFSSFGKRSGSSMGAIIAGPNHMVRSWLEFVTRVISLHEQPQKNRGWRYDLYRRTGSRLGDH